MKMLLIVGLALSLPAFAGSGSTSQGSGYGKSAPLTTGRGTDISGAGTMGSGASEATAIQSGNSDPNTEANENLERSNTSATPIPQDTTLQGKIETGPYKKNGNKQLQESQEENLDYRDQNSSGNQ